MCVRTAEASRTSIQFVDCMCAGSVCAVAVLIYNRNKFKRAYCRMKVILHVLYVCLHVTESVGTCMMSEYEFVYAHTCTCVYR